MRWGLLFVPLLMLGGGYEVYKRHCAQCHEEYRPIGLLKENFAKGNALLHLKAPTINQLSFRLKQKIGDPQGDPQIHRFEVVEFIKEYVTHPDPSKSLCMDEVLRVFDTMPPLKLTDEDLEAVGEWIYEYDKKQELRAATFEEALKKAKKEHKLIIIEATSKHCHYCQTMERTTLRDPDVVAFMQKHFVFFPVDVYEKQLPMGLKWQMTPTFFFVNANKRVLKVVPGAWKKEDFMQILKEVVR